MGEDGAIIIDRNNNNSAYRLHSIVPSGERINFFIDKFKYTNYEKNPNYTSHEKHAIDRGLGKPGRTVTTIWSIPSVESTFDSDLGTTAEQFYKGLSDKDKEKLDKMIKILKLDPETAGVESSITITGHASSKPTKYNGGNEQLSLDRANGAKEYLLNQGVPEDKINIIAAGTTNPKDRLTPESSSNQRTTLQLTIINTEND